MSWRVHQSLSHWCFGSIRCPVLQNISSCFNLWCYLCGIQSVSPNLSPWITLSLYPFSNACPKKDWKGSGWIWTWGQGLCGSQKGINRPSDLGMLVVSDFCWMLRFLVQHLFFSVVFWLTRNQTWPSTGTQVKGFQAIMNSNDATNKLPKSLLRQTLLNVVHLRFSFNIY